MQTDKDHYRHVDELATRIMEFEPDEVSIGKYCIVDRDVSGSADSAGLKSLPELLNRLLQLSGATVLYKEIIFRECIADYNRTGSVKEIFFLTGLNPAENRYGVFDADIKIVAEYEKAYIARSLEALTDFMYKDMGL